jgi:tetratricopeptide (TPR) repeat protein
LVIEDAHWLDSASWALLRLVSQEVQPVLLIVATRPLPQPIPTAYEQLSKAATTDLLQLKPLPANDAVAIVCRSLGVSSLPKPVASLIEEKAKGHPLFSELLAFALRNSGCLEIINAECRLRETDHDWQDLDFTDTLPQVVAKLLSHLSPDQLKELEQASVIGHVFDRVTLAEVYPQNTGSPPPPDSLAGLDQSGLTSPVSSAPNRLFGFKHPLVREVVYGELNPHRRRELHQAVASWLERTQVDVLPFYYPLLAYHWSRVVDAGAAEANVIATATDYLAKAGQQALSYGANQEAVEFFDRVLAVDRQSETNSDSLARARWERQLGEAYLALNQLAESRNHLERAVTLLGRPQPDSQLRLLTSLTEQVLVQTLHRLGSAKFDRRSPDAESAREVVRTYERLASIYLLTNDKRMLVNASLHALNLAENCGTPFDIARAYAESCVAAGAIPLHPVAEAYQRQALAKARALERCPSQAWVLEISGRYGLGVGQWTQAEAALEEAAEIADSLKDQRRRGECLDLLGSMACYRGQFEHSATLFVEAYASLCQRGNAEYLQAALLGRAQSLLRLGQTEQAFTLLETVQQSLAESPGLPAEIWIYGLLSLVHLRRGDQLQAHRSARMGVQLIGHSPPNALYLLEAYADVAEVYLALWNANGGLSRAERSTLLKSVRDTCRALHDFARAFPIGQPRAWVFQGLYDWHAGQTGKAHKAWQKGLAQAERLEMPYEEGLAHYEIGRHLPFDDPQQEKHLTRACELFARLEARHDLKQARQSLATRI